MRLLVKQYGKRKRVSCKGGYISTNVTLKKDMYTCIYIYINNIHIQQLISNQAKKKTKRQDTARFEHKILQNKQPHETKS